MGKKILKLPFFFKITKFSTLTTKKPSCHPSWRLSCYSQTKTLSFRSIDNRHCDPDIFRTINSAYLDPEPQSLDEGFTLLSTTMGGSCGSGRDPTDSSEIQGVRSERLFSEPREQASSSVAHSVHVFPDQMLSEWVYHNVQLDRKSTEERPDMAGVITTHPFKESVVLSVDSEEPYLDFRKSMKEMVETHGLKDWKGLEELLCWYLKANGKSNHECIIQAFVDFLVAHHYSLASSSSCTSCSCNSHNSSILTLCNTSPASGSNPCIVAIRLLSPSSSH